MNINLKIVEAIEYRNFIQEQFDHLEAQLSAGYGSYESILEHERLAYKVYDLNLSINVLMNRQRAKRPFWKKLFRK